MEETTRSALDNIQSMRDKTVQLLELCAKFGDNPAESLLYDAQIESTTHTLIAHATMLAKASSELRLVATLRSSSHPPPPLSSSSSLDQSAASRAADAQVMQLAEEASRRAEELLTIVATQFSRQADQLVLLPDQGPPAT